MGTERETGGDGPIGRTDPPRSVELNGNKEATSRGANGAAMSDVATSLDTGAEVTCNKEGTPQTRGHSTANCDPDIAQEAEEKKKENVWSALRKIKEANTTTPASVPPQDESETLTLDEFDNLIKNLSANLKQEVIKPEKLESVAEKDEEETKSKEEQSHQMIFNGNGSVDESEKVKEFVYDEWKAEMENLFGKTEECVPPTEKSASDEAYLENLRRNIAETVKKQSKDFNQSEKQKDLENKEKVSNTPAANTNTPPANVNDFGLLKLKEKERKKRKKEAAFQSHVVESTDRLKEMSIKTAKIEKLSTETESELLKLRQKAVLLVQKSAAKENEIEAIFKDIDNIDAMVFESDKKKKKGSKGKKEEIIAAIAEKNELQWTEEDRGKWESNSSKQNHSKVSEVLSTMKAMACQGNSEVINSLKSTISHCQKAEQESNEKKKKMEEEQKQIEAKKREEEKQKKQKEEEEEKKNRMEEEKRKKAEEEKKRRVEEEKRKRVEEENKKRVEDEKRKRAEEETKNKLEAEKKKRAEEDAKQREEEEIKRRDTEEQQKKILEEEKLKRAEEEKKKVEEEERMKKAKEEEEKKKKEDEKKKVAEQQRKREEEVKKKEDERKREDDERKREKEERQKREEDKLQKAAVEKQLDKDKTRLEENQNRLEEEEKEMEEDEEDKRIEELEKRLELKKTEEAELILKEEKKLAAPMKIEEERKKIEEDAAESLQQIMAVKQQLQKVEQVKSQPKPKLPTKVMVVNSNSFVPQKNTKHEIGVIKMGSPSQIRRA